jgi:hypothetical protein
MFMVLALGTLMDLNKQPRSKESLHWYNLGRASLSLTNVMEKPSMAGVQALVCYNGHIGVISLIFE